MSKQERRLYEFGRYRLVPAERLLLRDGESVSLTPKAFEMLVALVSRCGRLVEKNELLNEVWPGTIVEESNVAQNVFTLRRALAQDDDGVEYIETVPKRGYRFVPPVRVLDDDGGELRGSREVLPVGAADSHAALRPTELAEIDVGPPVAARPEALLPSEASRAEPASRSRNGLLLSVAAVALLVAGALVYMNRNDGEARAAVTPPVPAAAQRTISLTRLMSGERIPSAAISADGRYVAHVAENGGRSSIHMRQISTITDLALVPPDNAAHWGLTFSRDRDWLYYVRWVPGGAPNTLYRVSVLGGRPTKVLAGVDSPISFAPDGRQIAFVRDSIEGSLLMIANADGTAARVLATRTWPNAFFSGSPRGGPSWSPDGRTIVTGLISLGGGYHGEVIAVSVADGRQQTLTSERWYQVGQVGWLYDGSGLLVTARNPSRAQIWHVAYPSGAARRVTADLNDYHGISLTADSRSLVTVQYDRQSTLAFVPEKPPSAFTRNTRGMDEGFYGMSWTPAGELVYASEASGNLDIWLVAADGVTTRQLTNDPEHDSTPSVSPDGRSVVFISRRHGGNPHVWRMEIDGSNPYRLTHHASEGTPSFTPDGKWVVYAAADVGVLKVPSAGGTPVVLAGNAAGSFHTPSVSPDGKFIVCFYRDRKPESPGQLALLSTDGGPPLRALDFPEGFSGATIRWTPDSRALIHASTRNGASNLWTYALDGRPPQRLTDFTSERIFSFAFSPDHKQLAVARGTTKEHAVLIHDFR